MGFKIADEIASRAGIRADSDYRIKSGLLYTLLQAVSAGHTYLPFGELKEGTERLLGIGLPSMICMCPTGHGPEAVVKKDQGEVLVYGARYYYMEMAVAKRLLEAGRRRAIEEGEAMDMVSRIEKERGVELDPLQREAVLEAAKEVSL